MEHEISQKKINSLLKFGSKPGLERIKKLVNITGIFKKDLDLPKFIHVAGTNGKGSTCTLISSILMNAGYKTGLFVSPYVTEFNERMQINGVNISSSELEDVSSYIFKYIDFLNKDNNIITEFEAVTAMALKWFVDNKCDFVVLETGLGGRFDATNVIKNTLICVITSISLDHVEILGNTKQKIAYEKSGIIKPGSVTVVYPKQDSSAMEIIKKQCNNKKSKLIIPDIKYLKKLCSDIYGTKFTYKGNNLALSLLGEHQIINAITVIEIVNELINKGYKINLNNIKEGLHQALLPARIEVISYDPLLILDGSHNEDSADVLAKFIKKELKGKKTIAMIGLLKDKKADEMLNNLAYLFDEIITVTINNKRAMKAFDIAKKAKKYCPNIIEIENTDEAINYMNNFLKKNKNYAGVVWGSLYLAGEVRMKLLDLFKKN